MRALGILRRPDDLLWSPVDLATQAFGQSISVTPIQLATAVGAAINGGLLLRPRLVSATVAADGTERDHRTEVLGRPISPESSDTIRTMLGAVIDPGWFHPGKPRLYTAGGKSGTANVPIPNGYDDSQIASFVGFAPLDEPQILILIKLDENQDFLTGTAAAGPIFAALVDEVLPYLRVPPDAALAAAR